MKRKDVEFHLLNQAVTGDAMGLAVALSIGDSYEVTEFRAVHPESGAEIVASVPVPDWAQATGLVR